MKHLYNLAHLDKNYSILPLVARTEGSKEKGTYKVEYLKTYPPYPWRADTGDHFDEDPATFIDLCAADGLVRWENAEERAERLKAESKKENEKHE